jgi:NitT/TauT family transport system ATP-binding protein
VSMQPGVLRQGPEKPASQPVSGQAPPSRGQPAAIRADHISLVMKAVAGGDPPKEILRDITLSVGLGEVVSLIGPSGCGKTTFLNTVAGLEPGYAGSLEVLGDRPSAGRAEVGYAMSRDALLPWRTALRNVELGLEARRMAKKERRELARDALERVGLGDYLDSYRAQLSQGMRQRVALARTLVGNPSLLLLDEPFAALDAQTRVLMQEHLARILTEYRGAVLLVTHDIPEAIVMSDRVLVFSQRPAHVSKEFTVDVPRPRSIVKMRSSNEFASLQDRIWSELAQGEEGR